jgi:dihydropteroate synthase
VRGGGAALVITHTHAPPKTKAYPDYDDVVASVREFLERARGRGARGGRAEERIVLDPASTSRRRPPSRSS